MRTSTTALALSLALCSAARAADPIPAGGVADLTGPRSLGLAADIGAASGNEGLYVNPGAIAARQRYAVELGGLFDRRGADTVDRFFGGSIVDSESSPITAGVSFMRAQKGAYSGNLVHLALAGPLAEGFFVGVSGKYLSLTGQTVGSVRTAPAPNAPTVDVKYRDVNAVTADAGLLWQVAPLVSVGLTGYNLVPVSNALAAPLGMGAGVALGSDRSFQVTGDWRTSFESKAPPTIAPTDPLQPRTGTRWAVGAEALLFDLVPVRAGWTKDGQLGTKWWSAGVGLVTPTGVALDVGYRQSMDDGKARIIAASLKFFVSVPK